MKIGSVRFIHSLILCLLWQMHVLPAAGQEPVLTDAREESSSFETKFVEASILHHREKYTESIVIWEELLKEDRRNADVAFELSKSYLKIGKIAESLETIDRAIRYDPTNIWFLLFKTGMLEESARYTEAAEVCELLITREPSAWSFYKRKADNLAKAGLFSAAAEALSTFENQEGGFEELYQRKYDLFLAAKNIPSAVEEVEKLVQLKPENTYYLYLLATHLQELGLADKSLLLFNEILRIDPSDARASIAINQINANPSDKTAYLKSLQNIMTQKGGDVDAKIFEILPYLKYINGSDTMISKLVLETCSLLVIGHPQNAKSNALYGDALKLAGQFSDAIIYYQKSISIDKRVFAVFDELLQLLYHSGEFAAMKKLAEETIDYYPNQSKAVIWYAISLIHTKQYQQALAELDQASLMGSGNAELMGFIYAWEARAKIFQKQFKESVESYRKAVQISGGSQDVLNMALYDMTDYPQTRADALSLATSIQQGGSVTSPEIILLFARLDASLEKSATAKEKLLKISNNQLTPEGLEYKADVLFLLGDREAAVSIWELAIKEGGLAFRIASKIKDNRVFP